MTSTEFMISPASAWILIDPKKRHGNHGRAILAWLISRDVVRFEDRRIIWNREGYERFFETFPGGFPKHVMQIIRCVRSDVDGESKPLDDVVRTLWESREFLHSAARDDLISAGYLRPEERRYAFIFWRTEWVRTPEGEVAAKDIEKRLASLRPIGQPRGPDAASAALAIAAAGSLVFMCPWLEGRVEVVPGLKELLARDDTSSGGGDFFIWPDLGSDFSAGFDGGDGGGDGGGSDGGSDGGGGGD